MYIRVWKKASLLNEAIYKKKHPCRNNRQGCWW